MVYGEWEEWEEWGDWESGRLGDLGEKSGSYLLITYYLLLKSWMGEWEDNYPLIGKISFV